MFVMAKKKEKNLPEPMDTHNRVEKEIRGFIEQGDVDRAIAHCEKRLKSLPKTAYHKVLGRNWLAEASNAAKWLIKFYKTAGKQFPVKSLYCEMNRFEINADEWYLDGFAYDSVEEINDFGWLSNWNYLTDNKLRFNLPAIKDIQKLFARDYEAEPPKNSLAASELAILLLTIRMQQLIHAAVQEVRQKRSLPESVPVFAAAHDSDLIFASVGAKGLQIIEGPKGKAETPLPDAELPPIRSGMEGIYMFDIGRNAGNSLPWDEMEFSGSNVGFRLENKLSQAKPLSDKWRSPKVEIKKRNWRCDFFRLGSHWAVNARAKDALVDIVGNNVEFLPVKCAKATTEFFIIHPLLHVDLGPDADFDRPAPGNNDTWIKKYSFELDEITSKAMFRVNFYPGTPARKAGYAHDNVMVSTQIRKMLVEKELCGIVLKEVFKFASTTSRGKKRKCN
jgi:hypothetical protein